MKMLVHLIFVVLIANKVSADFLQCYVCEDCAENEGHLEYCEAFEEEFDHTVQGTTQLAEVGATTAAMDKETSTVTQGSPTTTAITYMETGDTTNTSPNATTTGAGLPAPDATIPSATIVATNISNLTTSATNSSDSPLGNTTRPMYPELDMSTAVTTFDNETTTNSENTEMATEPYVTKAEVNDNTTENTYPTSSTAEANAESDANITATTEITKLSTQEILVNQEALNFTRPSENMTITFGNETIKGPGNVGLSLESETTDENETTSTATPLLEPLQTTYATLLNAEANEGPRPTRDLLELLDTGNKTLPNVSLNGMIDREVSEGATNLGNPNASETVMQNLVGTLPNISANGTFDGEVSEGATNSESPNVYETVVQNLVGTAEGIFNATNFERPNFVKPNVTIPVKTSSVLFGNMTTVNKTLTANAPSSISATTNSTENAGLLNNTAISGRPTENSSSLSTVMNNTNIEAAPLNNTTALGLNGISNVVSENITNSLRPNGTISTGIVGGVSKNITTLVGFNNTEISTGSSRRSTIGPLELINSTEAVNVAINTNEVFESLLSAESAEEAEDLELPGVLFMGNTKTTPSPSSIFEDRKKALPALRNVELIPKRFAAQMRKDNITYKCYTVRVKGKNKVHINKGCIAVPAEKTAHSLLANRYGLRALEDLKVCSESKCNRSEAFGLRVAEKILISLAIIGWIFR